MDLVSFSILPIFKGFGYYYHDNVTCFMQGKFGKYVKVGLFWDDVLFVYVLWKFSLVDGCEISLDALVSKLTSFIILLGKLLGLSEMSLCKEESFLVDDTSGLSPEIVCVTVVLGIFSILGSVSLCERVLVGRW